MGVCGGIETRCEPFPTVSRLAFAGFDYNFPPLSLTLFTFAPSAPRLTVLPAAPHPSGQIVVQLQGEPGVRYFIQNSRDLAAWSTVSTNALITSTLYLTNPVPAGAGAGYWRALWQP